MCYFHFFTDNLLPKRILSVVKSRYNLLTKSSKSIQTARKPTGSLLRLVCLILLSLCLKSGRKYLINLFEAKPIPSWFVILYFETCGSSESRFSYVTNFLFRHKRTGEITKQPTISSKKPLILNQIMPVYMFIEGE